MDISTAPAVTWRDRNIYPLVVHSAKAGKKIQHVRGTSEKQDFSTGLPYVLPMKHHTKNQSDFFRPLHRGVFQAPAPLPLPLARYLPPTKEIHNSINESEMRQPKKKDIKTFSSWICWKGTHFNQTIFPRLFYKKEKNAFKNSIRFLRLVSSIPFKNSLRVHLERRRGNILGVCTLWTQNWAPKRPNHWKATLPGFRALDRWNERHLWRFCFWKQEKKWRNANQPTGASRPRVPFVNNAGQHISLF